MSRFKLISVFAQFSSPLFALCEWTQLAGKRLSRSVCAICQVWLVSLGCLLLLILKR